jgi:hypothetical protein
MMAKRPVDEVVDGNDAYLKRQKLTHSVEKQSSTPIEEILGNSYNGFLLLIKMLLDQDTVRIHFGSFSLSGT